MDGVSYSDVLLGIRSRHEGCGQYGNPVRFIYWAKEFGQGVGVSFVDPAVEPKDDCVAEKVRERLFQCDPKVLSISNSEDGELGSLLSVESMRPLDGLTVVERSLVDVAGRRLDPVVLCWVDKGIGTHEYEWETDNGYGDYTTWFDVSYHNVIKDYAYNDYTNRAFNYFYIKKLMRDKELAERILEFEFFTDGVMVSRAFGYSSPAYALALYKSLRIHGVLDVALRSFDSFLHFHPYDQIVSECEVLAARRFAGGIMTKITDPIKEIENEKVELDHYHDDDYDYDDDLGPVYYVDDCPVYGCGSQEEAEIEYWNTH